jgi:trigger factor
MKSSSKEIEHRQVELYIEAEEAEFASAKNAAFRKLAQKAEVPGFRKGKTPRPLLEQFLGKEAIADEAIEDMFPDLYEQALQEHEIQPIGMPRVSLEQRDPPAYKAIVPLMPKVSLGDYKSVRLTPEETSISDEQVQATIDRLRESQAVVSPVERPVELNDLVTLDVHATVVDGEPFLDHHDVAYQVVEGSQMPIPGFAESLLGMTAGESKEFGLKVPDDFRAAELAGKDCLCNVTVKQVRVKEVPEMSDDIAQTFGFDTADALKERINTDLETRARDEARNRLVNMALDAVAEKSEVEFPPMLEDREIDDLISEEARRYGYKTAGDYLKMTNRTAEEIREDVRPLAHKRIVNGLLLEELATAEQIEISDEDVDNRIEELLTQAQDKERMREYMNAPEMRRSVAGRLETKRTIDRLVAIVTGAIEEEAAAAEPAAAEPSEPKGEEDNGQ